MSKMLSDSVADDLLTMITIDKRFRPGDQLPNENDLSKELNISRTTLRAAIRSLVTNGILEIKRGKGTFVTAKANAQEYQQLSELITVSDIRDLFEMRLIFEPENAYLAAKRATKRELETILEYGKQVEQKILKGEDRTKEEQAFHEAIAKATHNTFMNKMVPIIFQGIRSGVLLLQKNQALSQKNVSDDRMIMEFLQQRNAEGARTAMRLHIIHAMQELGIEMG